MDCSLPGSSIHGDSPGKNIEVGCHALLQGIFPTQGLNPHLPPCRWILYHLNHWRSSWILEWVAYPLSRGSSQPRNQTRISHITDGFFTSWATREAHDVGISDPILWMKKPKSREFRLLVHLLMSFWLTLMFPGLGLLQMTNHFPVGQRPTSCQGSECLA